MAKRPLEERIYMIRKNLAAAFGGYSQYNNRHLGEAIKGHINNASLHEGAIRNLKLPTDVSEVAAKEAAIQECDQWEWDTLELGITLKEILGAIKGS